MATLREKRAADDAMKLEEIANRVLYKTICTNAYIRQMIFKTTFILLKGLFIFRSVSYCSRLRSMPSIQNASNFGPNDNLSLVMASWPESRCCRCGGCYCCWCRCLIIICNCWQQRSKNSQQLPHLGINLNRSPRFICAAFSCAS